METVVAAARACLGARFRPHGRDPAWGLDCVGLAARALGLAVPADYPLRGGRPERVAAVAAAAGLAPGRERPGDLLLVRSGPDQLHLVVLTDRGFVHADAGLGRVVEVPGRPEWPVLGCWERMG